MRLIDQSVSLGPVNIPVSLLVLLSGVAVVMIVQRTVMRDRRTGWNLTNEWLTTALLLGFLVWKLMPLVTRFDEIREDPLRLVWYAGGLPGLVGAAVVAAGYVGIRLLGRKHRARAAEHGAMLLPMVALPLILLLIGAVVPVEARSTFAGDDLTMLEGQRTRVGEPVPTVLVYWATWCGPCTAQMPEVERASERLAGIADVIAVNMTYSESATSDVDRYLATNGYTLAVALDRTGELSRSHEIAATPTTLVYDAEGAERIRRVGSVNADWIVRKVMPHVE